MRRPYFWLLLCDCLLLCSGSAQDAVPSQPQPPASTAPTTSASETAPKPSNPADKPSSPAATASEAERFDEHKVKRQRLSREEEDLDPDWEAQDPFARMEVQIGKREEPPPVPPPPCASCKDLGFLFSERAARPFLLFETEMAPQPEVALGWTPCPVCARGKLRKAYLESERIRLANRSDRYANHAKELGMDFIDFETRHVTGHFQTSPAEARECGLLFEKVAKTLREHGCSAYLQATPEKQRMVICENEARYLAYLEHFTRQNGKNEENLLQLARKTSSFGSQHLTVIRRDRVVAPVGSGLGHIAVFSFAQMLVREAAGKEAPAWFVEGFSSLCETLVFEFPLCYSIKYEPNPLSFEPSWAKAVAEGLKRKGVREWSTLFNLDMIGMSVLDYQQCWSVVRFLYHADGEGFNRLPALFKGAEGKKAIEIAFGQPIEKLEAAWRVWAAQGR